MRRNNKGVILIEAVLALGIIVVIMTALVGALIASVNSSNFSKDQTTATGYAQEGIEIARNSKDASYDTFAALPSGTYCIDENQITIDTTRTSNCEDNVLERFARSIYINKNGNDARGAGTPKNRCNNSPNSVFVASTVAWTDSKCKNGDDCHIVELNSCFADLYKLNPL